MIECVSVCCLGGCVVCVCMLVCLCVWVVVCVVGLVGWLVCLIDLIWFDVSWPYLT